MQKREHNQFTSILIGSGVIGVGVGWLAGLSVSPVISNIITSVVAIAAAVVTALSGLDDKDGTQTTESGQPVTATAASKWKVNPWPLATLLVGPILGTSVGIWARTHDSLGVDSWAESSTDLSSEVERWKAAGMDPEVVVNRLFDRTFPEGGIEETPSGSNTTLLFDDPGSPSECKRLGGVSSSSLNEELTQSAIPEFNYLAVVTETSALREVIGVLCESIDK
jgi:hypothetical protein